MMTEESCAVHAIKLAEGFATPMGDGLFILRQRNGAISGGPVHNIVLSLQDLETMRASDTLEPIALEDGEARWMGEGDFLIFQKDETQLGHPVQSIFLCANDAEALRLAA